MTGRGTGAGGVPVGPPPLLAADTVATDADLLAAHVAGDRDAFTELFRRHRDRLWAVAVRTIGDREEAADALQDALLSAHRAAARFRGDSAVTTWLHRIVVNACLDRMRRRQAHPTVPLPDGNRSDDPAATGGVEPAAPAPDHDTALVVRQALAQLPVEQRAALVLVDVQGYPVAEVARILHVAEGTVKSRCARGRARLAVLLGHLRTGGDGPSDHAGASRSAQPDVPGVTSGNPRAPGDVGSGPGRSRKPTDQRENT
ncbi:RNA polymerase sigma factor SigM [Micromonospora sagamiensis]|uniref:RNA polymerase, sigma subunit, ECF family n=1 Tax=Micromonospora sagamiensis TaxID=47875 RepID=A0A562WRR9_9ACTN|nr:RNA polymerase sigma factor SigM [Micromonospora sagamiensis]TWJ32084.1 RNA polymerase, sigma subunit, ECF family [Micromonospora sagamiensis]BCL14858.1 RNA polymerase sigma factor SigM [Micromonospora sagamiensis]